MSSKRSTGTGSRTALAVTLSACLLGVGATAPARAAAPPVTPDQALAAAQFAYQAWKMYKGEDISIEEATGQIISAIDDAKEDIMGHIELIDASEIVACADHAVNTLADIPAMSEDTLMQFAVDSAACLSEAKVKLDTYTFKPAIDNVAFAMHALGPIVLVAQQKAGFSTLGDQATLREATLTAFNKLDPTCSVTYTEEDDGTSNNEAHIRCVAHNGDVGEHSLFVTPTNPLSLGIAEAKLEAERNTSRPLSREALKPGVLESEITVTDDPQPNVYPIGSNPPWQGLQPTVRQVSVPTRALPGSNVRVVPDITHASKGQLRIELIAPNGQSWLLKGENLSDTSPWQSNTQFTRSYTGEPSGLWTLKMWDHSPSADHGTFRAWSLAIS